MNTPPFKRVLEYQSDDFQTKQRPPQEFPGEFTPETTLSGISRPFFKTSSVAILKQTVPDWYVGLLLFDRQASFFAELF